MIFLHGWPELSLIRRAQMNAFAALERNARPGDRPAGIHDQPVGLERAKALNVVRLSRHQDEGKRAALSVAPGVELGGEPASRPAEPLGLPSSFLYPPRSDARRMSGTV